MNNLLVEFFVLDICLCLLIIWKYFDRLLDKQERKLEELNKRLDKIKKRLGLGWDTDLSKFEND